MSTDLRSRGNAAFVAGNYEEADDLYAEALLELLNVGHVPASEFATLHANRSAALLKQNRPAAALEEAENAVNKNPNWSKAYFRKGEALKALLRWKDAFTAFQEASRLSPAEASLKAQVLVLKAKAQKEEERPALDRLQEHIKNTGSIALAPVTPTYSQFTILDELGEGNYSQVFKAQYNLTNEIFALKVIDKKKAERMSMRHGNLKAELRAERRILSKLKHPNIIKLFLTFQDVNNIYYVEEFCSGKELWFKLRVIPPACLKKEWPIDSRLWGLCGLRKSEGKFYLAQVLNALCYLRKQGIVHRDLKPENIMIAENEQLGGRRYARVKLIDFGTARDLFDARDDKIADDEKKSDDEGQEDDGDDEENGKQETGRRGRHLRKNRKTHFVGTAEFMSPEAVHGRPADHRSDLWSFGCTCFQIWTGRTPFKGASDYLTFLKADAAAYALPSHFKKDCDEERMLKRLLQVDPNLRISRADDLKNEDLFKDIDFAQLESSDYVPRVPLPSLTEICVDRIGTAIWVEAEAWGEGPLTRKAIHPPSKANNSLHAKRRRFDGDEYREQFQIERLSEALDEDCKRLIRGWLEQRSVLSCSTSFKILYGDPSRMDRRQAEESRIFNHSFLGYSQQEEGHFSNPFVIGVINGISPSSNGSVDEQTAIILNKFNESDPTPRLLVVAARKTDDLVGLNKVREDIPIARVPIDGESSEGYFSFWLSGVLFMVIDGYHFDEEQASWFDRELLVGKLCARYCIVISNKKWFTKSYHSAGECLTLADEQKGDDVMDVVYRHRFLKEMQESGVQLIIRVGANVEEQTSKLMINRSSHNEPNMSQVETPSFPGKIRIVRLLPVDAISDAYENNELTGFFYLDDEGVVEEGGDNEPAFDSSDEE